MRALGASLALACAPLRSVSWIASAETASILPRNRAGETLIWAKALPAKESPTASINSLRLSIFYLLLFVRRNTHLFAPAHICYPDGLLAGLGYSQASGMRHCRLHNARLLGL